ncbi:MAG TPA: MaoC family dehydratase [Methylomirabilota bacterium]|jgi:acyl dehydratase|nr:MaoC family dehydratase [Methylomirabilota bacterium]
MPESLPEHRVKARNTSGTGENKIHDDAVARRYGFRGGLVPGVTLYAYLTQPLVATLGAPWLARGTASVRFVQPVLDGEEVTVTGAITARDPSGVTASLAAATAASDECAVATAMLPARLPTPVNIALYGAAPLPAERPPVSRALLERPGLLGTPEALYDEERAATFLDGAADPLRLYRGPEGWAHPAFFLDQANRALDRNVRLGLWIHVSSRIRHLGGARVGERLETRGRVRSLYEKKGREYVELDLLIVAGPAARPVAHVLHTAIYRLPPP